MKRVLPTIVGLTVLAWTGCDNMQHQSNLRPLDPSAHFADGASARNEPAHAVPRGQPWSSDPIESGFRDGVPLEHNPLPVTAERLARGRERFSIYCAVCHGEDGYGTGIVVRRGFPAPPSYHEERLRSVADGHLFDVITRGYGVMLPYSDRLSSQDRWAVVAYIRALQRSQHATLADVPESVSTALLRP